MSSTHKKVIVRLKDGALHQGYLPDGGFVVLSTVELLLPSGKAFPISMGEIVHIAYVRDFNFGDSVDPERIGFRSFLSKPRIRGLWVRISFATGDTLEGIVREDGLAFVDAILQDSGIFMDPPNPRGNTQRLFIPRPAMAQLEVLAFSGNSSVKRRGESEAHRQAGLFDLDSERVL